MKYLDEIDTKGQRMGPPLYRVMRMALWHVSKTMDQGHLTSHRRPLTEYIAGMDVLGVYRNAVRAGLIRKGGGMLFFLTPKGADIVQQWLDLGHTFLTVGEEFGIDKHGSTIQKETAQ